MTSVILSELRALKSKVDAIQGEISQLHTLFIKHSSQGKGQSQMSGDYVFQSHIPKDDSHPENSLRIDCMTNDWSSAEDSFEQETPTRKEFPELPDVQTIGSDEVMERDEDRNFGSRDCFAEETWARPLGIPSNEKKISENLHGRIPKYHHRFSEECKEECLRKALQQNIVLLVENLPCSENDILDMLIENECLTETECSDLRDTGSRKDRVRNLVRKIKGRSFRVIKTFVESLQKFHPDVAASIWLVYEKMTKDKINYNRQCAFCMLKRSVDVKFLADHLWGDGVISDELYDDIVSGRDNHESLWIEIANECNVAPKSIRQNALRKFSEALMNLGQYRDLVLKICRLSLLKCACLEADLTTFRFSEHLRNSVTDMDELSTASPLSTSCSYRSFADESDIISDDDDFVINEQENQMVPNGTAEHERRLFSSILGLRRGSLFDVNRELQKQKPPIFALKMKGSYKRLDHRRASMFM